MCQSQSREKAVNIIELTQPALGVNVSATQGIKERRGLNIHNDNNSSENITLNFQGLREVGREKLHSVHKNQTFKLTHV